MKLMKILGAIGVSVFLLLVLAAKFATVESRFQCPGEISSTDGLRSKTVYLKLDEYRWWVRLWSKSDATVHIEIPKTYLDVFTNVKKEGDYFQIFDSPKELKGMFSTLSRTLSIQLPAKDFFDGTCTKID